VLAGLLLVLGKTGADLIRYPALLTASGGVTIVYLLLFAIALAIYGGCALFGTRPTTPDKRIALRQGTIWGLLCGGVWIFEVLVANVAGLQLGQLSTVLYFGSVFAGYLLPAVAGLQTARRTGRAAAGLRAGLLSGMLGGLILFLAASAAPAILAGIQPDAQTLREYQQSGLPDLDTFLAGDFLAGMIAHLWIGIITGLLLGLVGALVGKALARLAPG